MRIEFERSGGFAGLTLGGTVDTGELPEEEARALSEEIDAASFFALPHRIDNQTGGADRFQYRVTVHKGWWKSHTVEVGEENVPEPLRPLIERLERLVRTRR